MMTKEEVAQIITYCDENKISYKQRLSELGINAGIFSSQSHKACQIKERKTCERAFIRSQEWCGIRLVGTR